MKTILLPILGVGNDEPALALACRVAELFSAHIDGLHVQRRLPAQLRVHLGQLRPDSADGLHVERRLPSWRAVRRRHLPADSADVHVERRLPSR